MNLYLRATISAQNTWSNVFRIGNDIDRTAGPRSLFAKAIMTDAATVSVQMKRPDESDWITVQTMTQSDVYTGTVVGSWDIRIGVATGNFVSNSVEVEIGVG